MESQTDDIEIECEDESDAPLFFEDLTEHEQAECVKKWIEGHNLDDVLRDASDVVIHYEGGKPITNMCRAKLDRVLIAWNEWDNIVEEAKLNHGK